MLTLALQQGVTELGGVLLSLQLSQEMVGVTGPPVPLHAQVPGMRRVVAALTCADVLHTHLLAFPLSISDPLL